MRAPAAYAQQQSLWMSDHCSPVPRAQPRDPAQARLQRRAQGSPAIGERVARPRRAAEPRLGALRHPPVRGDPRARRLLPALIARACTQTPRCRARLSCAGRSRTFCSSAARRARTRPRASCTASASTRPRARSPERRRGRPRSDPSAGFASCPVPCSSRPAPSRGLLSALGVRGCVSQGLGGHDGSWLASCPRGLRARRNRSSWT